MTQAYRDSMEHAVNQLVDEIAADGDSIKGVIVSSGKKTFFAGGDLKLMTQATPADAEEIFENVEAIKATLRKLETCGKPVVAAVNGAALGGGLEIPLSCHHRIAVAGGYEIGVPEVTLGLLPGAGGITRTVRMFGLQDALMNVLLQGPRMKPAQAKEVGIVDEIVDTPGGAPPGGPGLDRIGAGRRGRGQAAVGPRGLQDPRWSPVLAEARAVPPGLPVEPAQAGQGCRLPGAEEHHGRGRRGCPGRLRDRDPHRVPLPGRPDHRAAVQEHDAGVLLRPRLHQRRRVASGRHRATEVPSAPPASRPSTRPRSASAPAGRTSSSPAVSSR